MTTNSAVFLLICLLQWGGDHWGQTSAQAVSGQNGLEDLKHQVESLTQSLLSYVQGYQDLRTKYEGLRKDLTNVTGQLVQTTTAYESMVKRYDALERKYNNTRGAISKVTNDLSAVEGRVDTSEKSLMELELRVNQTASVSGDPHQADFMSNISSRVRVLEGSLKNYARKRSPVAFQARLSSKVTPSKDTKIVFNATDNNDGAYYSVSSGVFTAPYSGIYLFTVTLTTRTKDPDAYLMKNGVSVLPLYDHSDVSSGSYDYRQASASVVVHMVLGDRVWVEWNGSTASAVIQDKHETLFSGALLQADITN